jgi:hypothetical protein
LRKLATSHKWEYGSVKKILQININSTVKKYTYFEGGRGIWLLLR